MNPLSDTAYPVGSKVWAEEVAKPRLQRALQHGPAKLAVQPGWAGLRHTDGCDTSPSVIPTRELP